MRIVSCFTSRIGQTAMLLLAGLSLIALTLLVIDHQIIHPAFRQLVEGQALEDNERALAAIDGEVLGVGNVANNWAYWDDAYAFAQNHDPAFIKANFPEPDTLSSLSGVDLLALYDRKGSSLLEGVFQPTMGEAVQLELLKGTPPPVLKIVAPVMDHGTEVEGLIATEYGPLILVARPILTTAKNGSSRGVMLMGRFLNGSGLKALSHRIKVGVSILARQALPPIEQDIFDQLAAGHPKNDGQTIQKDGFAYRMLTDIENKPLALLRTRIRGEIWNLGERTGHLFQGSLGGIAVIFLICLLFYRDRMRTSNQELLESDACYRSLFEMESDSILLVDNESGRILEANSSAVSLYGYDHNEILTKRDVELSAEPEKTKRLSNMIPTDDSKVFEIPLRHHRKKDGTIFPVEITGRFFIHKGNHVHIASIRNITQRKQAEEECKKLQAQVIQAQKMESIGRLAGGVAHDFNNMLGVILGYTQMALDESEPNSSLHNYMLQVLAAGQRSANITRQLLAFARKQTIAPKVLNLNETIEQGLLQMLRRLIGENIDLAWKPKANLWKVKIDGAQLDQLLVNLCINARDAITGTGKITIETEKIILDELFCMNHPGATPGEFVLLAVNDDGCGMDKAVLDKIFEPFFTTKEVGQGTGLGMATVYGIVKQNNGFIEVVSAPSLGTTFSIYLPRHKVQEAYHSQSVISTESDFNRGHGTILLVEDELVVLEMLTKLLQSQGYVVLATASAEEAVELAEQHAREIHLLVTDVMMPMMNGSQLANHFQLLYPDIKQLFMSGYTADIIASQGVIEENVNFIQKPFSSKDFTTKVAGILATNELQHIDVLKSREVAPEFWTSH